MKCIGWFSGEGVNAMIKCYHLHFKQKDQSARINEQRTGNSAQSVLQWNS